MSGLICPNCEANNSPTRLVCEKCGFQLQKNAIIIRPDNRVDIFGRQLPAQQLKRIGASLMISAAALLAEVGFVYLRRRLSQNNKSLNLFSKRSPKNNEQKVQKTDSKLLSGKRVVSVYQEQVVEELRWGRPVRRIISRMAWRSDESIET